MRAVLFFFVLLFLSISCNLNNDNHSNSLQRPFNHKQWLLKRHNDYPIRSLMVDDILHNDSIRNLSKLQIIDLLGNPDIDRQNDDFLYYIINQKKIASLTIHTKSLVFKFSDPETIEWIKIHE